MHNFSAASIKKMIVHRVGNRHFEEGLILSEKHIRTLSVEEEEMLVPYFLNSFQSDEYEAFSHATDLELNEAYNITHELFLTSVNFVDASKKYAEHLFDQSIHASINGGEFYVVFFDDVVLDGQSVEAIGLFKSERKDRFMQVGFGEDQAKLNFEEGINLKRLDKGCIIFNTAADDGFKVLTQDYINKGEEAKYWKEDFLGVKPISSEYSMTKDYMNMCKDFVMEQLPEEFEVDRTVQIEMLNRSSGYFVEADQVNSQQFAESVLEQPQLIESFNEYKENYQQEHNVVIEDEFEASKQAVKSQKKNFKSVLKLDKNFHIYVHGNPNNIEQGYDDERGMKFYKVFYKEEK